MDTHVSAVQIKIISAVQRKSNRIIKQEQTKQKWKMTAKNKNKCKMTVQPRVKHFAVMRSAYEIKIDVVREMRTKSD